MENNPNENFTNELKPEPKRPVFLKVLLILTFINCGFWILIYFLGSLCNVIDEESAAAAMEKVSLTVPNVSLSNDDPYQFFQELGKWCLYGLVANLVSLMGAIMMWQFNKMGFFIYAVAEIAANFFGGDTNLGDENGTSYAGIILTVIFDIAFIAMYAIHLKYMNKNKPALS